MSAESYPKMAKQTLAEAFPEIPLPVLPFGGRVLVQVMRLPNKTESGLVLVENTRDTAKWNAQTAKLVAVGPLAFKNRETGRAWPEGIWAKVGDFVRIPRWDGDRIEVDLINEIDPVVFVTFNDAQLIGKVHGDPTAHRIYEL